MLKLPKIGQGTWNIPESGPRKNEAVAALRRGVELGLTHIDTAEMYGSGRAEEIVAEAIEPFDRADVFVTTKVLPGNASYAGTLAACERSLRRLRTDYIDLYLLHWPSEHPLGDTMRALERLVHDGKARHIGVSNFDVEEVREAQSYLRSTALACDQVLYHLKERAAEVRLIPYCWQNDIAVVGYTPFGRGRFPAKEAQPAGVIGNIARKYGTSTRAVILNFLTRKPNVFTIPKSSSIAHVEENASALGWSLSDDDCDLIDAAFPVHDGPLATL